MSDAEEEAAGFRAAVHHRWAQGVSGRGGAPSVPGWAPERYDGAPDDASEAFLRGWRQGKERSGFGR